MSGLKSSGLIRMLFKMAGLYSDKYLRFSFRNQYNNIDNYVFTIKAIIQVFIRKDT